MKNHREHFGATGSSPVDGHEKYREHFGATEMAPTGPSPVDGHEKITENILARPDRRRSMVMKKKTQSTFWLDRDGTDRIVAGRWS